MLLPGVRGGEGYIGGISKSPLLPTHLQSTIIPTGKEKFIESDNFLLKLKKMEKQQGMVTHTHTKRRQGSMF